MPKPLSFLHTNIENALEAYATRMRTLRHNFDEPLGCGEAMVGFRLVRGLTTIAIPAGFLTTEKRKRRLRLDSAARFAYRE